MSTSISPSPKIIADRQYRKNRESEDPHREILRRKTSHNNDREQ